MKKEVCPYCGKPKDESVAFGLQKRELAELFANTVGPKGHGERARTGRTGYELFAIALQKISADHDAKIAKPLPNGRR